MKKFSKYFLIIVGLFVLFFAFNTKADSGWDSDYDSGGSWDSGSDYDYDYDYDNDYDYDYDYDSGYSGSSGSGGGSGDGAIVVFFVVIIFIIVLSAASTKKTPRYYRQTSYVSSSNYGYDDIGDYIFEQYGLNKEELKKEFFNKFIDIQNAWMNFDYDSLSKLCTNELYNTYKSQLNVLKIKNGKNIMHSFKLLDCKITQISKVNNKLNFTVYMKISFYDYVINTKTCKVTRGKKYNAITNNYIMTFIKGDKVIDKCPCCGAKVLGNTTDKCEYCRSVIVKDSSDYILSKKSNINR